MSTNTNINGTKYYRIYRKVGVKRDSSGAWVDAYKNFYGKTKAEAEAKYNAYMQDQKAPEFIRQPFFIAIDEWIRNSFVNTSLAPATKQLYKNAYYNYMDGNQIATFPVKDLTAMQLQVFFNDLRAPVSTIEALHKLLRRFYKYLAVNYNIADITAGIELPKRKTVDFSSFHGVTTWNIDELKKVLAGLENHRLRLLVILAVNTGARIGELLALEYSDFRNGQMYITKQLDEKAGEIPTIREPKTANSIRAIPLTVDTLDALRIHAAWHRLEQIRNGYKTNFVFTTETGNVYYKRNIYRALSRYYARIGVTPHRFHDFRHTFASMLSGSGTPIETTSALLGHADISTTAKYYIGVSTEQKLRAVDNINSILTVTEQKARVYQLEYIEKLTVKRNPGRMMSWVRAPHRPPRRLK